MIFSTHGVIANSGTKSTLSNNIIAAYKAENNANNSLGVYNGTAQGGVTYTAGMNGTSFDLNGTNAYINMGDVLDVGLNSQSYSLWFNLNSASNIPILFSKTRAGGLTGRFWAGISTTLKIDFNLDLSSGTQVISIQTTNTINLNVWYNLTCVIDRANNMKIYLNGVLQNVTNTGATNNLVPYTSSNFNNGLPFRIGAYTASDNVTATNFFNGKIDEFNIWNRVLTTTEITELYNSGNGKFYPY